MQAGSCEPAVVGKVVAPAARVHIRRSRDESPQRPGTTGNTQDESWQLQCQTVPGFRILDNVRSTCKVYFDHHTKSKKHAPIWELEPPLVTRQTAR